MGMFDIETYQSAFGFGNRDKKDWRGAPSEGMQWIGDQQMPSSYNLVDHGKGWYDVMNDQQRVGVLRPGGATGKFNKDPNYVQPLQMQQARMLRQPPAGLALTGQTQQLGNPASTTRQYAPNPFIAALRQK